MENKGKAIIDVEDDGNLYIEVGYKGNAITQLGSKSSTFLPYKRLIQNQEGKYIYSPYMIRKSDLPAVIESVSEFMDVTEKQVNINEYIDNWVKLGAETLHKWISQKGIGNDLTYVLLDDGRLLSNFFFNHLTKFAKNKVSDAISMVDDVDPSKMKIVSSAPNAVRKELENIIYQANREDRDYDFTKFNIPKSYFKFLDGFLNIDKKELTSTSKNVILVTTYVREGLLLAEAYRRLHELGINVAFSISLATTTNK